MTNQLTQVKTHFLYPAAIFVSREPYLVTTILGSCVAVCLWDEHLGIGGINHYLLPLWNGQGLASPKYGNISIEKLTAKMFSLGCKRGNMKAKIFGGSEILRTSGFSYSIGTRNVEVAKEMLNDLNIKIVSSNSGGKVGRKILFNTRTGEVKHKLIEETTFQ